MSSSRIRSYCAALRWLFVLAILVAQIPAPADAPAQSSDCRSEVEPNNVEAEVERVEGGICITGDLPESADQDLYVWTVSDADAQLFWTMSISGPSGVVTDAKVLTIASEPGVEPIVAGERIGNVATTPESTGPATSTVLVSPGRYLIGVSRTDTADAVAPATTDYELSVLPGDRLPGALDAEPNDDASTAIQVGASFETAGDLQGSVDTFAWTLSEEDAASGWEIHARIAIGNSLNLTITRPDGTQLLSAFSTAANVIDLYDLALEPGTYLLQVGSGTTAPVPYVLRTNPGERPTGDLEPNDLPAGASAIDLANPVIDGRLAASNDIDLYRLTVDDQLAGSLFNLRVFSQSQISRRLCIVDIITGVEVQCKDGPGGAALANLLLPRGEFLVKVSGDASPSDRYILRLDVTTPPSAEFETEPNDVELLAATFDPAVPMHGRFDGNESDTYRITISGEPQLWDLTVTGAGIGGLLYTKRDGSELGTGSVNGDRTSATLSDLYLTPGDHWIRVSGVDGEYVVALTPMGPPPPDGELEANNSPAIAEPMLIGERKTGRLVENTDVDTFRFSLAAEEHIVLALAGPDDGTIQMSLDWSTRRIAGTSTSQPGEQVELDLKLLPGDYTISLYTRTASTGRYALDILREDPFAISDDLEPNDSVWAANRLPGGSEMQGTVSTDDPNDYYLIAPEASRDLTFTLDEPGVSLELVDDQSIFYTLSPGVDGVTWSAVDRIPDDIPLYLVISGSGSYTVTYGQPPESPGLNLPGFVGSDQEEPLEATFTVTTSEVAAYWHENQIVDGLVTLTNTSDDEVEFVLSPATSHFHFTVEIDDAPSRIGPGATIEVPVSIQIEPDAWADIPVRITVAAILDSGHVSAFAEITPTAAAPPINASQAWPVPVDLLGGLDLASPLLGAVVAGTVDPAGEALLHDGVAPYGVAFMVPTPVLPLTLTVDLAGDAPAPVSGIVLNPQPFSGLPWEQVRGFELLLSADGVNFVSALHGELSLIVREQSFVLPEPIEATHAQLVILSTYDTNPTAPLNVSLNEWSVIASPGYAPETVDRLNIADLALGGHVVRSDPQFGTPELAESILTPDLTLGWLRVLDVTSAEWVIGFADNRAALVTGMAFLPATGSNPVNQITSFEVEIAIDSSSGPWQSAGRWDVSPASDGTIAPFRFEEPTWARFVRLSGAVPGGLLDLELPGQIAVYEAPTGDEYRSVIGAWGASSSAGYFEVLNPPVTPSVLDEVDAPDDPDSAAALEIRTEISGRAHAGSDVDWYRVTAPEGDNTLTFTLRGIPSVDVVVRVYDENKEEVPATRSVVGDTSTVTYAATVEPGSDYLVRVEQPPHSIVFTYDTSGSMGGVLPMVYGSLRSFADGITEGQEFVQVIGFENEPLLETFSDDSYAVGSATNRFVDQSGSSSAETAIIDATELLEGQEGTTAILIITDAETSSYTRGAEMWARLDVTQPRIFAVHVAGNLTPARNASLMQDWSDDGGYYQYAVSQGEMDRAFDRAATWLRRPAGYSLIAESSFQEESTPTPEPEPEATSTSEPQATETTGDPGTLRILPAESSGGEQPAVPVSDQVTIELILDTSGSMLAALPDGQRRIDVARSALTDLVINDLPAGVPVALRVFGATPDSCETRLLVPVAPLDPAALATTIGAIEPVNLVKTPIGASLEQVASDLAGVAGPKIVVLVTDGEETCAGDPAAAIQALIAQGIDVQVNIVGFALEDDALREQFRDWAALGNGSYFDATSTGELDEAIAAAVQAPFRVLDATGTEVARGTVGGDPVELPAGTYTVVILTDPEQRIEHVVVEPGGSVELELDAP